MATQIAATPILRGEEAMMVIQEAQQKPDEKTQKAFAMLKSEFSRMTGKKVLCDAV
ncbi:MAG: hypothetical protein K5841_02335 [Fretibacterium sp.]|nr:hypothetical protein [Fretibacterium sp.]